MVLVASPFVKDVVKHNTGVAPGSDRSAILCHLGNIVRWVGRRLRWDPETETFPGDDEANAFLDRPRRPGFELPDSP